MMKACIFDLDGTLADTLESIARAVNRGLEHFGYEGRPVEEYNYYAGDGLNAAWQRALNRAGGGQGECLEEGIPLVEVPQTVRNLSEAMKETESLVYAGRFHHSNHPVMNWMMSNVTVKPDKNDNIFPNKSTPEAKIDGPVAMFTAMSRMLVNGGEPEPDLSEHLVSVGIRSL